MNEHRKTPPIIVTDNEIRGLVAASTLDRYQRATLLAMVDGLYRHTLEIHMGIQRLADALDLGRRATIYRIGSLESTGAIAKVRGGGGRFENGRGRVNVWRLDLDALRNQAIAKAKNLNFDQLNSINHPTNKGAVDCIVKSAVEQHQGCSEPTPTVHPTAHDPILPIYQEKKTNGITCSNPTKAGKLMQKRNLSDLRPYVNKFDSPRRSRADKLKQMRMQLEWDGKNQQRASKNRIH